MQAGLYSHNEFTKFNIMSNFKINTTEGGSIPALNRVSILDNALSSGLVFNHSCKNGQCGVCKVTLLEGEVIELQKQSALNEENSDNKILTCCCMAASDILIDANDLSAMHGIEVKILPTRINSLDLLSEDIMQVKLRLPPASNFEFLEGQFIDIIGPNSIRRSYSIASISSNKEIIILIKRVKGGEFSNYWFNEAKSNNLLRIEGPKGTFFLRDRAKPLVFLATGTGIAPIVSILDGLDLDPDFKQTESISLFWGNRVQQDFVWKPNFKRINVRFYPIISRDDDEWRGEIGYVQDVALRISSDTQKINVYACGASNMINSAKASFVGAGLSENDFYSDAFVQSY
jgi:CDP-4-dehydro-6-deoxyglucose reductase, E3